MSAGRAPAVAVALALLLASAALAGCGLGPGEDVGAVSLTVTRDFGAREVVPPREEDADESDTVMRVLERGAEIDTRYGGGFVQSIDGLEADSGNPGPLDWFFFVNGIESPVGAADVPLAGGERIWWDYRDWSATIHVAAVVGSWPAPFAHGYEGRPRPVAVECLTGPRAACATVRERISGTGARLVHGAAPADAIRVLVGAWSRLRRDPVAATLGDGPQKSGVYMDDGGEGLGLEILDEEGEPARPLGNSAGVVAATRHLEDPPTWIVTGKDAAGITAAAGLLGAAHLRRHYAIAVEGGEEIPMPVR